jgi:hypothetical protein
MIELHDSRRNLDAKPDIITCNSVLNACAFENAHSESERATIMDVVAKTLDIFQASAPKYGYPDHSTYAQVLLAISKHMPMNDRRLGMAETTFWQVSRTSFVCRVCRFLEKTSHLAVNEPSITSAAKVVMSVRW